MGQEVTEGDRPLGRPEARLAGGVEALEHLGPREVRDDLARGALQTELAALDELHDGGRRDRLGHRGDPHHRVRRHRRFLAELPLAERALVERPLVCGCGRDDARHGLRLHGLAENLVETLEVRHAPLPLDALGAITGHLRHARQVYP